MLQGLIRLEFWSWEDKIAVMAESVVRTPPAGKPKLLDQVRDVIRRKHYSIRTEQAYIDWIKRFIIYHGKRHPGEMAEEEVAEFLTHLARHLTVAASTQNQALSALLFLYKEVLKHEIGWLEKVERAKKPPKLPVVLSRGRGEGNLRASSRRAQTDGGPALWQRVALDGMRSATS
jgi:hypothetical protein